MSTIQLDCLIDTLLIFFPPSESVITKISTLDIDKRDVSVLVTYNDNIGEKRL